MFDFLNNPWETDEQKRQKLNNSQTQTPFNGQQTPNDTKTNGGTGLRPKCCQTRS